MELFKLLGKIVVDNVTANDNIDETTEKAEESASKLSTAFSSVGSFAMGTAALIGSGLVAAATGIGALTKSAIEGYADYEQLVGGVETLFKDSADTVIQYSSEAYMTAGLSANTYMETVTGFSASLLQSLGGDTEAAANMSNMAITDMSDNANKMGSDIDSIISAYTGFSRGQFQLLDNLKLGYGGTQTEMERLLQDATAISGVEYDISSYSDMIEAIHVIQTEMGITGTTQKEASETISGSIGMMKAAWSNFLTGMADDSQNFNQLTENLVGSVTAVADNLVPRIAMTLPRIVQGLIALVNSLAGQIPTILQNLLPSLIEGASTLFQGILEVLPSILSILLESLPLVLETIMEIIIGVVQALPELISTLLDYLPTLILLVVNTILMNLPLLIQCVLDIVVAIINALPDIIIQLNEALPQIISMVVMALIQCTPMIIGAVIQMIASLVTQFPELFMSFIEIIPGLFVTLAEALENAFPEVFEWLSNAWDKITLLISTAFGVIVSLVDAAFQIITLPFRMIWENCKDTVYEVWDEITGWISEKWELISSTASTIFETIKTTISDTFTSISETISPIIETIETTISGVWENIKTTAETVWGEVKTAIETPITEAKDTISTIIDTIEGFFEDMDISFPDLALPHFSISPSGWVLSDLLEGTVPSLSISWYAKGGVMDGVTPFGVNGNNIMMGGEAGKEAIIPLENDTKGIELIAGKISQFMPQADTVVLQDKMNRMIDLLEQLTTRQVVLDSGAVVGQLAPAMNNALGEVYEASGRGGLSW